MTNTPVLTSPASVDAAPAVKKIRAASLPAKYAKFVQFGYYLVKHINNKNTADGISLLDEPAFLEHIHMFDAVDVQQSFVQQFFDESKTINQTMRKAVQQNKKNIIKQLKIDAKPPKVKKVRATTNANKSKKASKKTVAENDFVAEMVSLATSSEPIVENVTIQIVEEPATTATATATAANPVEANPVASTKVKAKRTSKAKAVVETPVTVPVVETPVTTHLAPLVIETPVTVPAKAPAKSKKTKTATPATAKDPTHAKTSKSTKTNANANANTTNPTIIDSPSNHLDDELDVEPFIFNGIQYLIDDLNNIYHFDNHNLIGIFNPNDNLLNLI